MWTDALAACHKEGGDLASIQNIEEQSFVISQSGYCKCAISYFFSDLSFFTTIIYVLILERFNDNLTLKCKIESTSKKTPF